MRAPAGVFTAAYLFAGVAACWLSAAIATLFAVPQYGRYYENLHADPTAGGLAMLALILAAVPATLVSALAVLLAVLDAGGRPAARAWTYILAILAVVVSVTYLRSGLFAAVPWHHRMIAIVALVTLGAVVVMTVLLNLRGSRRYFRDATQRRRAAHPMPVYRPPYYPPPSV
jgi:hypothetical protein